MKMTITAFDAEFMNKCQIDGLSVETIRSYKSHLKTFSTFLSAQKISKLQNIKQTVIERYVAFLYGKKLSSISINNSLRFVRLFLNVAYDRKYIKDKVMVRLRKCNKIIKPTLNEEEFYKIVSDTSHSSLSIMAKLYLATGVRSRTMANIKVSDIDFKCAYIHCRVTKNKKLLILPLVSSVAEMLKEYINEQNLQRTDFLFTNSAGTQYNRKTMLYNIKKYLTSLEIEQQGVHLFRHTFAKKMALAGAGVYVLSSWLGDTPEVAEEYIRIFASDLALSAEKLNPCAGLKMWHPAQSSK